MIIKVCGLRDEKNIEQVAALGIHWIGLIFWPQSSRYVSMFPSHTGTLPDRTGMPAQAAPGTPKKVGVFVDATAQDIITRVVSYGLDIVQLHGHETPTLMRNLRRTLGNDVKMMKAISIASREDLAVCKAYEDCADYFLFDTKCKTVGGSGQHFDWTVLTDYSGETPFLLSGGIGPDDAERVRAFHHPKCIGIDLNSRFEVAPAQKDPQLIKQFLDRLESPDYQKKKQQQI